MDIPEHSGPSSRVLCQASEDRPRLSVEFLVEKVIPYGRKKKEVEKKPPKKSERVIEVLEKIYWSFFTGMMEPRTAVCTKRRYGNFPVSLVKHAPENCQKIQDLKECNWVLLLGFLYVYMQGLPSV